jgi:hypothetical protein
MRKLLLLSSLMLMLIPVLPSIAQDDCSSLTINRQIDSWYQEFLGSRSEVDAQETMQAAAELQDRINELLATCGLVLDDVSGGAEQTGSGTLESPFDTSASAIVADVEFTVTSDVRPADEILVEAGVMPANQPEGTEYVIIYIDFLCARDAQDGGCNLTGEAFQLVGDMGEVYLSALARIDDYVIETRDVPAGGRRSGGIPFLINSADTGLLLLYYPSGDPESEEVAYFQAQVAPTSMLVTTDQQQLAVRGGPGIVYGPLGSLNADEIATAIAISEDGEWLYIETSRTEGWVPVEQINADMRLDGLPVRIFEN